MILIIHLTTHRKKEINKYKQQGRHNCNSVANNVYSRPKYKEVKTKTTIDKLLYHVTCVAPRARNTKLIAHFAKE